METNNNKTEEKKNPFDRRKYLEWLSIFLGAVFGVFLLVMIVKLGSDVYYQHKNENTDLLEKEIVRFDTINIEKKEIVIPKSASEEHNPINTSIDLMNLLIVGGGVLLALMTLLVTLKLREWDKQHEDTKKAYDLSIQLKNEAEILKSTSSETLVTLKQIKKDTKKIQHKLEITRIFFIRYARALSKYYSHNYTEAIMLFRKIASDKAIPPQYLDDVYFHMGLSYFKTIDFTKMVLDDNSLKTLIKAENCFNSASDKYDDPNNKANAKSYAAISSAYMTNRERIGYRISKHDVNLNIEKTIKYLDEVNDCIENYNTEEYYGEALDKDKYFASAKYNMACAYAVLYRFNKEYVDGFKGFGDKALDILSVIHKEKRLIDKDYILQDQDWGIFVHYYSNDEERKKIMPYIGDFFSKVNSRWVIAKLCMDLYELTNQDYHKQRGLDLIKRCIRTRLITVEQLLISTTFMRIKNIDFKKEICIMVYENVEEYGISATKESIEALKEIIES